tara:strand:+ start:47646 stop:48650 length:1005 start_codon:yes stop_codon:yes gene_type:complete
MSEAKISILIPARNEEQFISDCLASIKNQSYQYWEAIVVDDHSSDRTASIIKEYVERDKRFSYLQNNGQGIIDALRTAYKKSTGELITRMDADDLMRDEKLQTLSSLLIKSGTGHVAVGGVHYFSADKVRSGFSNYEKWLNERTKSGTNFRDIFRECSIPSPNWMMFRSDLEAIGAFESDRYPEDYDLAFRMFLGELSVIPCDIITHDWRDYPTRTSRTDDNYKDHTFTAIKWHYFNTFFRNDQQELVIFGTGYRGKKLAQHLIENGVSFSWVSHNKEKIGKHIYDVMIEPLEGFDWNNKQIIATVAKDKGRDEVTKLAEANGKTLNKDIIHFA